MTLELAAARWLKYEKNCALVIMERSPRAWYAGQPDVLGVLASRYMLEVECKRSLSDFRANAKKRHMQKRFCLESEVSDKFNAMAPKLFWFMVPPALVENVSDALPPFAGLLTLDQYERACVVRPSPSNKASTRLSLTECAKLMNCAGNQMLALMGENFHTHHSDSTQMDEFHNNHAGFSNYQI